MKPGSALFMSPALICLIILSLPVSNASGQISGEALFKEYCASCHRDGGNILNPKKTLQKDDREANNIKTADDIIKKMRNPGPSPTHPQDWAGMRMFDQKTIPDENARKIADYILETFK